MKYLILLLLPFSAISAGKHDAQLCRAVKNDNHIVVMSKLQRNKDLTLDQAYKLHTCSGKTLLQTAEESPKVRKTLIRKLNYLTIRDEAKYER